MKPGGRGTTRPGTFTWGDGLSCVVEIESFSRNVMSRIFSVAFSVAVFSMSTAAADDARQVIEKEIDASLDRVWNAFTTTEGLKSWVAPLADIDFGSVANGERTTMPRESWETTGRSNTRSCVTTRNG